MTKTGGCCSKGHRGVRRVNSLGNIFPIKYPLYCVFMEHCFNILFSHGFLFLSTRRKICVNPFSPIWIRITQCTQKIDQLQKLYQYHHVPAKMQLKRRSFPFESFCPPKFQIWRIIQYVDLCFFAAFWRAFQSKLIFSAEAWVGSPKMPVLVSCSPQVDTGPRSGVLHRIASTLV